MYCDVSSVVAHVLWLDEPQGAFFVKIDLSGAYRLVPIKMGEWECLALQVDRQFYVDVRLPMGAGGSFRIFQGISDILKWLFTGVQDVPCRVFDYLDGFLMVVPGADACTIVLDRILGVCKFLDISV